MQRDSCRSPQQSAQRSRGTGRLTRGAQVLGPLAQFFGRRHGALAACCVEHPLLDGHAAIQDLGEQGIQWVRHGRRIDPHQAAALVEASVAAGAREEPQQLVDDGL